MKIEGGQHVRAMFRMVQTDPLNNTGWQTVTVREQVSPIITKVKGEKLGSFVINQRSGASKCRKTWNTTSHFDSQPLVNLVNYQSNFREEPRFLCPPVSRMLFPLPEGEFYFDYRLLHFGSGIKFRGPDTGRNDIFYFNQLR